jgi:hypothetical protein
MALQTADGFDRAIRRDSSRIAENNHMLTAGQGTVSHGHIANSQ